MEVYILLKEEIKLKLLFRKIRQCSTVTNTVLKGDSENSNGLRVGYHIYFNDKKMQKSVKKCINRLKNITKYVNARKTNSNLNSYYYKELRILILNYLNYPTCELYRETPIIISERGGYPGGEGFRLELK